MQLVRSFFFILQSTTIIYLLSCNTTHSKEKPLSNCLNKKNVFTCGDPYNYLQKSGTNIDKDIIQLSDLQLLKKKTNDNIKGLYIDAKKTKHYVKQANPITEIMGSRLMNLILGTQRSPIVKIVKDYKFTVSSIELKNFETQKKIDKEFKTILGEAELDVAMDFIGLVDRHSRNMGYIIVDSKTLLAARVDFDASFDFESSFFGEHSLNTNYLSLKHLHITINQYPKNEIINAIKKIITIPDEKIIMVIFQSWATLTRAGYKLDLNHCLGFANQLIERKNVFRNALNDKNSQTNQLIEKINSSDKKNIKQTKKKHKKK